MAAENGRTAAGTLRDHGLKPRKRLGQHFLRDRRYLGQILKGGEIGPEDDVLEVGAGTGVLTRALAERARSVLAIELDDSLAALLHTEFLDDPIVEVWHGNALGFDPGEHFSGSYKLAGNIPYYVTGPIVRHFLEEPRPPTMLVLMVQIEVARRMSALPGELSLLGLSVQFYSEPHIVTRVPRGAFYPVPRVDSAIIRLRPRAWPVPAATRDAFFTVARAGFGTRRKTLANALSIGLGISKESAVGLLKIASVDQGRRAQDLSLEEWADIARAFAAGDSG